MKNGAEPQGGSGPKKYGGTASVRVIVEPFVYWLWIGGLVIFFGALYGFYPTKARRKARQKALAAK